MSIQNDLKINNNLTAGSINSNNMIMKGNLKLGTSPTDSTLSVDGSAEISGTTKIGGTLNINGQDFNDLYNKLNDNYYFLLILVQ